MFSTAQTTKNHRLYLTSLWFLILLVLINVGVGLHFILESDSDAKIINLAGRQRMLSQKIAKQTLSTSLPLYNTELKNDIETWYTVHYALQYGNDSLNLSQLKNVEIQKAFNEITPFVEALYDAYQKYAEGTLTKAAWQETVLNSEKAYLIGMDAVVFLLDNNAEAKIEMLKLVYIGQAIVIVIVLLIGYFFYVKPQNTTLIKQYNEVGRKSKLIEEKNRMLENAQQENQKTISELQTVEEELKSLVESQGVLNETLSLKIAENEERASQMKDAQVLANLGYWSFNLKDKIIWSETMYTIFDIIPQKGADGPTVEEYTERIHPEDVKMVFENIDKVLKVKSLQYIHRVINTQNKTKYIQAITKVRYDQLGKPIAVFGTIQDITEQYNNENALATFNENLQDLVEMATTFDSEFKTGIRELLAYVTRMLGMEVGILSRIEDNTYRVESAYATTAQMNIKEGTYFDFSNTYCFLTYQNDGLLEITDMENSEYKHHPCYEKFKLESYMGVPIIVNKQKVGTLSFSSRSKQSNFSNTYEREFVKLAAQLVSYQLERLAYITKLERLNQSQENILHIVAHDLRAPLSKIYGLSDLIRHNIVSSEKERETIFQHIEDTFTQGSQLIEELLLSFSMEKENITRLKEANISVCIENSIEINQSSIKQKEITIQQSIYPDIMAHVDLPKLQRLFENLFSNALKFTPRGGQINVSLLTEKDDFILIIADTGIGIPEKLIPHLFEKFSKKIRRAGLEGEKSTGLGMSIVKQIIEQHKGTIDIYSKENEGTTFTIKIPLDLQPTEEKPDTILAKVEEL